MRRGVIVYSCMLAFLTMAQGCQAGLFGPSASERANATADTMMYQKAQYANAGKKGPTLIVLPGEIKSANATFTQKYTANNIADFGEIELGNANFGVLERDSLGHLLNEVNLAVNMGDPTALSKFKKGKFKSTKWFVKFDVLKAEPVAQASGGFSGGAAGSIFNTLVGGKAGSIGGTALRSTRTAEAAGVWVIGMRYKVIDASSTEQVKSGYFEQKMEMGAQATSFMGVSSGDSQKVTLDTMVQRLIQQAVMEMDAMK